MFPKGVEILYKAMSIDKWNGPFMMFLNKNPDLSKLLVSFWKNLRTREKTRFNTKIWCCFCIKIEWRLADGCDTKGN